MKNFRGKAIYNPSGKAGEYSYWACNFFTGCSNKCSYCFLRKGVLAHTCGGDEPTLKRCFRDEEHALQVFETELQKNLPELQKHGLFFSFTTDPMLQSTEKYTKSALIMCIEENDVPCKILSKCTDWVDYIETWFIGCKNRDAMYRKHKQLLAIGFTLTGHDELEPNASPNDERIAAIKYLHSEGFKTWASIEPIVDFESSLDMIKRTMIFCDLYKIGLEGGKEYARPDLRVFIQRVVGLAHVRNLKIYFKDSLLRQAGIRREELPENCVGRDFNIFAN
jgi:DNA repair photolyase